MQNNKERTCFFKKIFLGLSMVSFVSCASTGLFSSAALDSIAASSTCENPMIFKLSSRDLARVSSKQGEGDLQVGKIMSIGYKNVSSNQSLLCSDASIKPFTVQTKTKNKTTGQANIATIYAIFMNAAAVQADPNIECKQTFTQTYQPAMKLGGSGRVISVPNGEKCTRKTLKSPQ